MMMTRKAMMIMIIMMMLLTLPMRITTKRSQQPAPGTVTPGHPLPLPSLPHLPAQENLLVLCQPQATLLLQWDCR